MDQIVVVDHAIHHQRIESAQMIRSQHITTLRQFAHIAAHFDICEQGQYLSCKKADGSAHWFSADISFNLGCPA